MDEQQTQTANMNNIAAKNSINFCNLYCAVYAIQQAARVFWKFCARANRTLIIHYIWQRYVSVCLCIGVPLHNETTIYRNNTLEYFG